MSRTRVWLDDQGIHSDTRIAFNVGGSEVGAIEADTTGTGFFSGGKRIASFAAGVDGIANDPTGTTGVTVQIPTGAKHLLIFYKGCTNYNAASMDPLSMYVNGSFNAGATNYASLEFEVFNSAGTITTFQDANQSNNLRVGNMVGANGAGAVGSGVIFMPFVSVDSDIFGVKHFISINTVSNDATAQGVTPPHSREWLLAGGIWTPNRISDLTLYADNGTKFTEGSTFDFYAYY